jgi:hypothetical protein
LTNVVQLIKKLIDDFSIEIGEVETIILALKEMASMIATGDRNATAGEGTWN